MLFSPAATPRPERSAIAWNFAFFQGKLLLPEPEGSPLQASAPQQFDISERHYLGTLDGLDCWAMALSMAPAGWRSVPLRSAMMQFPEPLLALAGRAAQVLEWDRAHRFCGVCGTPTEVQTGERARRCPSCQHTTYPRISPAMMALVWRPGELLLARAPHYAAGMYSALAGFVEAGESIEECLVREVAEEVAVSVKNLRYYGSQSWPFPHSLMVAYTAQWDGGEIVPQASEIEDAQWFSINALPGVPPRFSIAGHLIRDTVALMQSGEL